MLQNMTEPFYDKKINIESVIQTELSDLQQWVFDVSLKDKHINDKEYLKSKLNEFNFDGLKIVERLYKYS
jgi:hypothetical protein